jgi:hypothetical protein
VDSMKLASPRAADHGLGRSRHILLSLALGALVPAFAGCYVHAGARGVVAYQEPVLVVEPAYVDVETVPVEVESYPSYAYDGGSVYLVEGQWYRHHGNRWVVYSSEPRPLASVRVSYEAKYGRNYHPRKRAPRPGRR